MLCFNPTLFLQPRDLALEHFHTLRNVRPPGATLATLDGLATHAG